jgi:hypothetical protein
MESQQLQNDLSAIRLRDDLNQTCIDCESSFPTFVSIAHGCFLCLMCYQSHLSLGSLSNPKPFDHSLTREEREMLTAGGNTALKEFFSYYSIMNTPISYKYTTKAARFYREMLTKVARNEEFANDFPSVEEASKPDSTQLVSSLQKPIEETKLYHPLIQTQSFHTSILGKCCKCLYPKNSSAERPEQRNDSTFVERIGKGVEDVIHRISQNHTVASTSHTMSNAAGRVLRGVRGRLEKLNFRENVRAVAEKIRGKKQGDVSYQAYSVSTSEHSGDSFHIQAGINNEDREEDNKVRDS